jgi:hypothetical protein
MDSPCGLGGLIGGEVGCLAGGVAGDGCEVLLEEVGEVAVWF